MQNKSDFKAKFGRWCVNHISNDVLFMKMKGYYRMGYWMNLKHPKTFQEKLNWLKLHDHKEIYHQMVDKYYAKKFIAERVGEQYVIPTIGCWNSFDEINFDEFPQQFIIKNTFDSGHYYICRDKSTLVIEDVRKKLLSGWEKDYYVESREWPYKGLKHRIIAEPLLTDGLSSFVRDCKVFCFNGTPKFIYVSHDISTDAKTDFYDLEWKKMDMRMKDPNSTTIIEKPQQIDKIIDCSKILAQGTYFLRVDFYLCGNDFYCGEMTFFHCGGFQNIYPQKWNRTLGEWIKLPIDK